MPPRAAGRDWELGDGELRHRESPRRFFIPAAEVRGSLCRGQIVRLLFTLISPGPQQPQAERMWVEVDDVVDGGYVGVLQNRPVAIVDLDVGDRVLFEPRHVIALQDDAWDAYAGLVAFINRRLLKDDHLAPGFLVHDPADLGLAPRADGARASGWQLLIGDETEVELADPRSVQSANLGWLMERYPPFGALVTAGASDGAWQLSHNNDRYERA